MNQITPDELLLLLGSKEAELFLVRRQLAEKVAEVERLTATLAAADAELSKSRAQNTDPA